MRKVFCLFVISLFFVPTTVSAQKELSEEQKNDIKHQAKQQVEMYENCLKYLASKKIKDNDKDFYYRRALNLFLGKGEEYKNLYTGKIEPPVKTQVSSVKTGTKKTLETKTYLKNLRSSNYSDVSMEEAQMVIVDDLTPIPGSDSVFSGVVHFAMEFVGYREGRPVYRDITWKDMEIVVVRHETSTSVYFEIKLGDSTVTATEKIG